jgi:hypothetical protein
MIGSLAELSEHFAKNGIGVKKFDGWKLTVGQDVWTLALGVFYLNGEPKNLKEKGFIDNYRKKQNESNNGVKTRNWRGIGGRNLGREWLDD